SAQGPEQGRPVDILSGLLVVEVGQERDDVALPERSPDRQFALDAEPAYALEGDQVTAVAAFRKGDDPADAADLAKVRLAVGVRRAVEAGLDQADEARAGDGLVQHLQIARLEYVERNAR